MGNATPAGKQYLPQADLGLEWSSYSMKGARPLLEDAVAVSSKYGGDANAAIFSVFDGHYGKRAAKYCAARLHNYLFEHHNPLAEPKTSKVAKCIVKGFESFDKVLLKHEEVHNWQDGTTALTMLVKARKDGSCDVFVANAGDCRAVVHTRDQQIHQVTVDHSPDLRSERKRIERAGGYVKYGRIEERLAVSRAFGDRKFKVPKQLVSPTPDVFYFIADPTFDFVILACDGIWNWISSEQAVRFVKRKLKEGRPVDWIVRDLVRFAYNAGSTDNISAIVVKFNFTQKRGSSYNAEADSFEINQPVKPSDSSDDSSAQRRAMEEKKRKEAEEKKAAKKKAQKKKAAPQESSEEQADDPEESPRHRGKKNKKSSKRDEEEEEQDEEPKLKRKVSKRNSKQKQTRAKSHDSSSASSHA